MKSFGRLSRRITTVVTFMFSFIGLLVLQPPIPNNMLLMLWDVQAQKAQAIAEATTFQWSPDGQRIAFTTQSQVCVINRDGSKRNCLSILPNPGSDGVSSIGASWSPDGNHIFYLVQIRFGSNENYSSSLHIFNPSLEDRTSYYDKNSSIILGYYLSPNSKYVALIVGKADGWRGFVSRLDVLSLDTLMVTHITPFGNVTPGTRLWSSDSERLIYQFANIPQDYRSRESATFIGPGAIYTNNLLGTDQRCVLPLTSFIRNVQWSPNDQLISYFDGAYNFILDKEGHQKFVVSSITELAWSPNGKAFAVFNGDPIQIYSYDSQQIEWVNAIGFPSNYASVTWALDGHHIALVDARNPSAPSIYIADLVGIHEMIRVGNGYSPAWSPDAQTVAFLTSKTGGSPS